MKRWRNSNTRLSPSGFSPSDRLPILLLLCALLPALASAALDPAKVTGPETCGVCHESALHAWERTHHHNKTLSPIVYTNFNEILKKMELSSARGAECRDCHFTPITENGKATVSKNFGASCESCHGAGQEWADKDGKKGGPLGQVQEK